MKFSSPLKKTWKFHFTATDLRESCGSFPLLLPPIPSCLVLAGVHKLQIITGCTSGKAVKGGEGWGGECRGEGGGSFPPGASLLAHLTFSQRNFHPVPGTLSLSLLSIQPQKIILCLTVCVLTCICFPMCLYVVNTPYSMFLAVLKIWQMFIDKQVYSLALKWAKGGFPSTGFRLEKQAMSQQNSRGKQRDSSKYSIKH